MNLERYEYVVSESFLDYEFYSVGPKGRIKKIVTFELYELEQFTFYSLAFGNYIEETGKIDVLDISDNKDTEKILATIFSVLLDFTNRFPDKLIYAVGSTVSRTRLYRVGIAKYWNLIDPLLLVYGKYEDYWMPFKRNVNYDAFLFVKRS